MSIIYNLEKPENKSVAKYGIILVEGWAFSTTDDIKKVIIRLGMKKYYANIGILREDVGRCHHEYKDKSEKSGFSFEIKLNRKQLSKVNKLSIEILDSEEKVIINNITINPQESNNFSRLNNISNAINKTIGYILSHGIPKKRSEFILCIKKFNYVINERKLKYSGMDINANSFEVWCIKNTIDDRKRNRILEDIKSFNSLPLISIIMPAYKSDVVLFEEAIESVVGQVYLNWELLIIDDCTPMDNIKKVVDKYSEDDERIKFYRLEKNCNISLATNYGVSKANGEFIFLMDHDDLITEDAIYEVVRVINENKDVDIIYSDDDKIGMDGKRYDPQFKPDFSPELLLSYMYFSHIFVIRKKMYDLVGGCRIGYEGSQDYDLALRITEKTNNIIHIPKILYHWRATPTSTATSANTKPYSLINGEKAVRDAVKRRGIPANVKSPKFALDANLGIYELKYNYEYEPLVSIIIPNKNNKDILKRCLESIISKSNYNNYEIIIVDNFSDDLETLNYLNTLNQKILKIQNINNKFNFSRMVNYGVQHAKGEYIILLNNDTEVISPTWIEDMLVYMYVNGVGVVGSKLIYKDGSVQHAGVVLKMFNGVAGHAFKLIPNWDGGYLSYANVVRNYSAVTAACLMTSKNIYISVGGFDEQDFGISFNDVDFCMKVINSGYRVVYNPSALLYHHEGKTRGVEQSGHFSDPKEEYNFVSRWNLDKIEDKYYNPNLSYLNEKFEIDFQNVHPIKREEMHILLITHNLNYEGAPLMQLKIGMHLMGKGYKFTVLSREDGPLHEIYKRNGIEVIIEDFSYLRNYCNKNTYTNFINILSTKLENKKIDLIYTNTIETFWGVKIAEVLNIPVVWGIHESVDFKTYFTYFNSEMIEESIEKFKSATKVAFVSDATSKMYHSLNTHNFITIKNGIELNNVEKYKEKNDKQNLRIKMGIDINKKVISIFGAVCFRKGQKVFLESAKTIVESYPNENLLFQIVGAKESSYLNEIIDYIKENKLDKYVNIVYTCADIYQYYVVSDFFVCASYEESSPQVILEAMAFGLPIVSTNVFGIPELVRDKREALLTEPGDSNSIAKLLITLLDNKELTEELKYNAYFRVKSKFTIDLMVQKYDKLFQSVYAEGENKIYKHYNSGGDR